MLWSKAVGAGGFGGFNPAVLFENGEAGFFYEPSVSTCFTDTGGTTSATYGDAVAYVQDNSTNNSYATQATSTARPILGRQPEGGRRNLLSTSIISNFTPDNVSVTSGQADPNGGTEAYFISPSSGTNVARIYSDSITGTGDDSFSISIKNSGWQWVAIIPELISGGALAGVWFDISNGVLGTSSSGYSGTISTNAEDPNFYDISVASSFSGATRFRLYLVDSNGGSTATASANGVIAYGPQFEEGSTATAYQKVVSQYDISEVGVRNLDYLFFNGSSHSLDFSQIVVPDGQSVFLAFEPSAGITAGMSRQNILVPLATDTSDLRGILNFGEVTGGLSNERIGWVTVSSGNVYGSGYNGGDISAAPHVFNFDFTNTSTAFRIDGNGVSIQNSTFGGPFSSSVSPQRYGRIGAGTLSGKLFGLILRGASCTLDEKIATEEYLAARSGITL